jgi:hypothetical protein
MHFLNAVNNSYVRVFLINCQNCLKETLVKLGQAVKILIKFCTVFVKRKTKTKIYNQLFHSLYS